MPRQASSPDSLRGQMTAGLQDIVNYFGELGEPCLEMILLEQGVWFEGRRHSKDYAQTKDYRRQTRPQIQQCFFNSQMYCCEDFSARYFEGFATFQFSRYPVEHAWIVMPDGNVVDFTLEALARKLNRRKQKCDTSAAVYLGMEIPQKFIRRKLVEEGETQPLLFLYFTERLTQGLMTMPAPPVSVPLSPS